VTELNTQAPRIDFKRVGGAVALYTQARDVLHRPATGPAKRKRSTISPASIWQWTKWAEALDWGGSPACPVQNVGIQKENDTVLKPTSPPPTNGMGNWPKRRALRRRPGITAGTRRREGKQTRLCATWRLFSPSTGTRPGQNLSTKARAPGEAGPNLRRCCRPPSGKHLSQRPASGRTVKRCQQIKNLSEIRCWAHELRLKRGV
jgi:hypothetical protein